MKTRMLMLFAALAAGVAFGRGESWVAKPPAPPPVATLTNEARYIEWKFREDVTDPSTGLATAALTAKVTALRKTLEPKEDWRVVKAKSFALLCDEMAIDVSPLDWYPSFAIWSNYRRPLEYFIVTSPEELRDAQRHPEKYENLQVRVCGWNVRWNDMPKYEQDEYILRAERIAR